jgi:hypothetical protein
MIGMEPLVTQLPKAARPLNKRVVERNKMSAEDISVSAPTVEPLRLSKLHSTPPATTTNTNITPLTCMHTQQHSLYTKTPLPPVTPEAIRILYNNTNALQIENEKILAKSIENYIKYEPTILGLIETKQNFRMAEQTTKPLRRMVQATLNSQAKVKLVTSSCFEEHTARNLKEPGGICQLLLGKILSLHKQSGSNNLGRWAWQELRIDGVRSLYVITAYRVCPNPSPSSQMKTAWHQQYRGLVKKGIRNPELREQVLTDLGRFLTKIRTTGAEYILGLDANMAYDHDDIQDFLQDHDMVDAFTDFFDKHPATHTNGSKQIDLISVSRRLAPYIN